MTVKELRDALADLPDDMLVVMAKDAEGNSHSPLADASEAMYLAETTWYGECYPTPEQLAQYIAEGLGHTLEDDSAPEDAVRVLLLGPVN